MLAYTLRRLFYTVPILLGISLIVFLLFHVAGGNPVYHVLGKNATPAEILRMSHQMGLDRPLWLQYLHYLWDILRGDFGRSWETKQRISEMLSNGVGPSLALALPAFLAATFAAVSMAMLAAMYRNRWPDRLLVVFSVLGMSI